MRLLPLYIMFLSLHVCTAQISEPFGISMSLLDQDDMAPLVVDTTKSIEAGVCIMSLYNIDDLNSTEYYLSINRKMGSLRASLYQYKAPGIRMHISKVRFSLPLAKTIALRAGGGIRRISVLESRSAISVFAISGITWNSKRWHGGSLVHLGESLNAVSGTLGFREQAFNTMLSVIASETQRYGAVVLRYHFSNKVNARLWVSIHAPMVGFGIQYGLGRILFDAGAFHHQFLEATHYGALYYSQNY
jgi:hypothetical protein